MGTVVVHGVDVVNRREQGVHAPFVQRWTGVKTIGWGVGKIDTLWPQSLWCEWGVVGVWL